MIRPYYIFWSALLTLLLVACQQGNIEMDSHDSSSSTPLKERVALTLKAHTSNRNMTKALNYITDFEVGHQYFLGNFVVLNGQETLYDKAYHNILTSLNVEGTSINPIQEWKYLLHGAEQDALYVTSGEHLDIYSYFPYKRKARTNSAQANLDIPFSTDEQIDFLYAKSSVTTGHDDKELVNLNFKHLMTCFKFKISKLFGHGYVGINKIEISYKDKQNIIATGTFNLKNQTINVSQRTDKMAFPLPREVSLPQKDSEPFLFQFLLPMDAANSTDDLYIKFYLNDGKYLMSRISPSFFVINGERQTSFKRGFEYTSSAVISNGINFSPISIDKEWTYDSDIDINIEL